MRIATRASTATGTGLPVDPLPQEGQSLLEAERGMPSSKFMPSWTIANATSGWMPTITVSAPRSRVM
ncbi:MAG: hypothetical protein ACR2IP_07900 [Solirubrobacteraceae bacterium]